MAIITSLLFTAQGHALWGDVVYLAPGKEKGISVFDEYAILGKPMQEPAYITSIDVVQQLLTHCYPEFESTGHKQRLVVDYIRIED